MTTQKTATQTLSEWLEAFSAALVARDIAAVMPLFDQECFWRDLVAFTWNIRTEEGTAAVKAMLKARLSDVAPSGFVVNGDVTCDQGVVEGWFRFETRIARCRGHVRLKEGRVWTLFTAMDELKGHEEQVGHRRPTGAEHGVHPGRLSWGEERDQEHQSLGFSTQPDVVIVGAGQAGLSLGARLRQLGVSTLILEKQTSVGDQWRQRYKSLCLHDPAHYCHFPYLPFPPGWSLYTPKDQLADWMESYARIMGLQIWTSSPLEKAQYNSETKRWQLDVVHNGEHRHLEPQHLVIALGVAGYPQSPTIPGQDLFEGEQHHSSQHPGPDHYRGKRCVVVGSNNSAHDIAAALWEAGAAEVTMLQRSSTAVVPIPGLEKHAFKGAYSDHALEQGITTEITDMAIASIPYRLLPRWQKPIYDAIRKDYADYYRNLEKAGFQLDFGDDESGVFMKFLRRGSGYYLDVGAAELVANGSIQLISGVTIECMTAQGLQLSNGQELMADLVVYATGYSSMNRFLADLITPEIAKKLGKVWGMGSETTKDPGPWEGELRNMWKPTQVDNLWIHGGNLHQCRYYSLYLALQLKARIAGIKTPVYGLAPSFHTY